MEFKEQKCYTCIYNCIYSDNLKKIIVFVMEYKINWILFLFSLY